MNIAYKNMTCMVLIAFMGTSAEVGAQEYSQVELLKCKKLAFELVPEPRQEQPSTYQVQGIDTNGRPYYGTATAQPQFSGYREDPLNQLMSEQKREKQRKAVFAECLQGARGR